MPKLNRQLILIAQKFSVKMPKKNDGYDGKKMTEMTDLFFFQKKKIFLEIFIFPQKNVPENVTQLLDRWLLTF